MDSLAANSSAATLATTSLAPSLALAVGGGIWLLSMLARARRAEAKPGQKPSSEPVAMPAENDDDPLVEAGDDPDLGFDDLVESEEEEEEPSHDSFPSGSRVQFHGLQKAQALNGAFGVVLRYEASSERFVVRKEVARSDEAPTVTVKGLNLTTAPPLTTLAALQRLIDSAPAGARVNLARGTVSSGEEPVAGAAEAGAGAEAATGGGGAEGEEEEGRGVLVLPRAISLCGVGSRSGGTVLAFCIAASDDCEGELLELLGFHCHGTPSSPSGAVVDIAPRDVQRVRMRDVSITAPAMPPRPANGPPPSARDAAAGFVGLYVDEIARRVPHEAEGGPSGRVTLEECWVRGGKYGVCINAVGVRMRRCRVTAAGSFGIKANATFAIEQCTIGQNATSDRIGGGILSRTSVVEVRSANGFNENRVQRDQTDEGYLGYQKVDCRGCPAGRCNCTAMMALAMMSGESLIRWDTGDPTRPEGRWQKLGWEMG